MRNELITKINEIFDENIDLKIKNELLESKLNKENNCCEKTERKAEFTELDKKVLEYGKKTLADKVMVSANINVKKLENGDYNCTKFEEWAKESIYIYYIPEKFSKEELINLLNDELKEKYNQKKANMIKEYEKKEGEK